MADDLILLSAPHRPEVDLLHRALRRSGREVRAVRGGRAVMGALASLPVDVVVMTDRRAQSECPGLIRWIRTAASTRDIPIVALVPHHEPTLAAQCYAAGCDVVVSTPLDVDTLGLAIDALLRRVRHTQAAASRFASARP